MPERELLVFGHAEPGGPALRDDIAVDADVPGLRRGRGRTRVEPTHANPLDSRRDTLTTISLGITRFRGPGTAGHPASG